MYSTYYIYIYLERGNFLSRRTLNQATVAFTVMLCYLGLWTCFAALIIIIVYLLYTTNIHRFPWQVQVGRLVGWSGFIHLSGYYYLLLPFDHFYFLS